MIIQTIKEHSINPSGKQKYWVSNGTLVALDRVGKIYITNVMLSFETSCNILKRKPHFKICNMFASLVS